MRVIYPSSGVNTGTSNTMGQFPFGANCCWHGGVHIERNSEIKCIADGHIVAYRITKDYKSIEDENGDLIYYSNCFVLVQHRYESPKGLVFVFYSLYNHLAPQNDYKEDDSKKVPSHLSDSVMVAKPGRVSVKGISMFPNPENKSGGFFIPNGAELDVLVRKYHVNSVYAEDMQYFKVSYTAFGKNFEGYMSTKPDYMEELYHAHKYRLNYEGFSGNSYSGIEFWNDTKKSKIIGVVPADTTIVGEDAGDFIKLTDNGKSGYVEKSKLVSGQDWADSLEFDKVVNTKIPVKSGQTLGYTGYYGVEKREDYRACHFEVFTDDESALKDFLKNAKNDEVDNGVVNRPYMRISGKVNDFFKYKLLPDTSVTVVEQKGNFSKVKIGSVIRTGDRGKELSNNNATYNGTKGTYTIKQSQPDFFDGILVPGDVLKLLDTQAQIDKADNNKEGKKPRKVEYNYPITGQEFWMSNYDLDICEEYEDDDKTKKKVFASLRLARFNPVYRLQNEIQQYQLSHLYPQKEMRGIDVNDPKIISPSESKKMATNVSTVYCVSSRKFDPGTSEEYMGYITDRATDFFPAHNWEKFDFEIVKESSDQAKYVFDPTKTSGLAGRFWEVADPDKKIADKDKTGLQFSRKMHSCEVTAKTSKWVCLHQSEWAYDNSGRRNKLKEEIRQYYQKIIQAQKISIAKKLEQVQYLNKKLEVYDTKAKELSFWSEIKIDTSAGEGETALKAFPSSPNVYFFNPVAFVEHIQLFDGGWHDPVDNPMLCLYSQSGNDKPWHGSFGEKIRDGSTNHAGIDLFALPRTPVYACVDGTVAKVYTSSSLGGRIVSIKVKDKEAFIARMKDNFEVQYSHKGELKQKNFNKSGDIYLVHMHLDEFKVSVNQEVSAGDLIALSGTSGENGVNFSTKNPHVHFEISNFVSNGGLSGKCNPLQFFEVKNENTLTAEDKKTQDDAKAKGY